MMHPTSMLARAGTFVLTGAGSFLLTRAGSVALAALALAPLACAPVGAQQAVKSAGDPPQNTLSAEERDAGWRLLFDGRTTAGWRGFEMDRVPDGWRVEDGTLARIAGGGDLITEDRFESFELSLDWKVGPGGNSGVFFHVIEGDDVQQTYESGPEMQVLDNARHADGKNPITSAGSNYALHPPVRDVSNPAGEWNHARLVVDGAHVEHWLNGVKLLEYELWSPDWERRVRESKFTQWPPYGRARTGHIGLQDHGDPVWFRNIKVRELTGT